MWKTQLDGGLLKSFNEIGYAVGLICSRKDGTAQRSEALIPSYYTNPAFPSQNHPHFSLALPTFFGNKYECKIS